MARVLLSVVLLLVFIISCAKGPSEDSMTGASVQELQETACDAADKASTCLTRLPELGFISPEECCEQYGRCCR